MNHMLYRSLLLPFFLALACRAEAQTAVIRQNQWTDSLATSEAASLQQQFQLSAVQTDSLHQAWLHAYAARRQAIARYWKTDSFPVMIKRADRLKDSLYKSVLGQQRFYIYKDSIFSSQQRQIRQAASPKPTKQ